MSDVRSNEDSVDKSSVSESKARKILERSSRRISREDIDKLSAQVKEKLSDLKDLEDGLEWLGMLLSRVRLLFDMVRDKDFHLATKAKLLIAGGLLYFVVPTDLTPDVIPGIGYVDDAMVIGTLWKLMKDELGRYINFLRMEGREPEYLDTVKADDLLEEGSATATN